ncbi:hypothetical protein A7U60_g5076 [Sanghuangporus baumii]|uniref:Uncharacterized protein n=1 Tax=Sanghuangporus baumii TaxID=108892 RepID=A0A9Q5NBR0_SANBA|nr:hypothetical protein A7U60_g5076 [Sanghuangporus baumii]
MAEQSLVHVLDEGALANDIVRLLGGENQRLKQELREAQQRAQNAENQLRVLVAEAGPLVKNESAAHEQSLPNTERARQLDEEIASLQAQYQELEAKYEEEKVIRKLHETEFNELKLRNSGMEESPAHFDLQEHRQASQVHIPDDDNCNDPWGYIDESHGQREVDGPFRIKSFQQFNKFSVKTIDSYCENTLIPLGLLCIPFVRRRRDILWNQRSPGFGVSLAPSYCYEVDTSASCHKWKVNEVHAIEGPFELLFETRGFWYYCGTFSTTVIESRKNIEFFRSLQPQVREILMRETVEKSDFLPPVIEKSIMEMYSQGVLPITCLVFERIGFNNELHEALLKFGKSVNGPEFAFESSKSDMKKEAKAKRKAVDGKILEGKRAKLESAQTGTSTSA